MSEDPRNEHGSAIERFASVAAAEVSPEATFAAVAEEVARVVPEADFTLVCRYGENDVEVVGAWSRLEQHLLGRNSALGGHNVSTLVRERGEPARVDRFLDDGSAVTSAARETGMRSSVGAPIVVEGRIWGLVMVASANPDALPPDTEHRLAGFTALVAATIAHAHARAELRELAEEQAALRRVATRVARGESPEQVFAAVAEEVGRVLSADLTLIGRFEEERMVQGVGVWSASGEGGPVGVRSRIEGHNVTAMVFNTRRPARLDTYDDATGDSASDARGRGVSASVGVPIFVSGEMWGVMLAATTGGKHFPPSSERRLSEFTELVASAIANAEARDELRASRARVIATADETRRRLERDLHDGAQHRLVALALRLRGVQAKLPPELSELAAELDRVTGDVVAALDELRELAQGIHNPLLTNAGLGPALRSLARRAPVPVEVKTTDARSSPQVETTAYFVASEAITNAAKHARPTRLQIDVSVRHAAPGDMLIVTVSDDGVGGADATRGSGLVGLRDRVEAIGGTLSVDSPNGRGTTIVAKLPWGDGVAAHDAR